MCSYVSLCVSTLMYFVVNSSLKVIITDAWYELLMVSMLSCDDHMILLCSNNG